MKTKRIETVLDWEKIKYDTQEIWTDSEPMHTYFDEYNIYGVYKAKTSRKPTYYVATNKDGMCVRIFDSEMMYINKIDATKNIQRHDWENAFNRVKSRK